MPVFLQYTSLGVLHTQLAYNSRNVSREGAPSFLGSIVLRTWPSRVSTQGGCAQWRCPLEVNATEAVLHAHLKELQEPHPILHVEYTIM